MDSVSLGGTLPPISDVELGAVVNRSVESLCVSIVENRVKLRGSQAPRPTGLSIIQRALPISEWRVGATLLPKRIVAYRKAEWSLLFQLVRDRGRWVSSSPKCHPEIACSGVECGWGFLSGSTASKTRRAQSPSCTPKGPPRHRRTPPKAPLPRSTRAPESPGFGTFGENNHTFAGVC